MRSHPQSAYFVLAEALRTIVVEPFDIRPETTFLVPAWLTDMEASIEDAFLINTPPFTGMNRSYDPGGDEGSVY